jgi:hypothetical protein
MVHQQTNRGTKIVNQYIEKGEGLYFRPFLFDKQAYREVHYLALLFPIIRFIFIT